MSATADDKKATKEASEKTVAEGSTPRPDEVLAKSEELVKVITSRSLDEKVASLVQESREFPDPLSIEVHEPFVDVFKPPDWCDENQNAYAWIDPNDDVQMERALRHDYWHIVTRSNHPRARSSDFRIHGAVERQGMLLVYRPKDLDLRLRWLSTKKHHDMAQAQLEGDAGHKWEKTVEFGENVPTSPGFRPVVGERAGQEGLGPVGSSKE